MQFAWGFAPPLIIGAAIRHGVFDALAAAGPLSAEELAGRTGTQPRGVRAVANALAGLGFLAKDGAGRYVLTPESDAFLVSSRPSFQGGLFKHVGTQLIPKWLAINETLTSGRPPRAVNREGPGTEFFEQFVEDIFPMSYPAATVLGQHLNVAAATDTFRVLDLAAGSGVWGVAIAKQSPNVRVTAVDWPGVLGVTRRVAGRHEVGEQFVYVPGDLATADFGHGYRLATLGHILHSEGEARSRRLLKRTFDALAPGGTVAVAEFLCNEDRSGPANATIFAVNMLLNTDEGDAFTFGEIAAWLREAGFADVRTLDAPGPSPLVLATKR
jgi:precorrin-6B methylase 2